MKVGFYYSHPKGVFGGAEIVFVDLVRRIVEAAPSPHYRLLCRDSAETRSLNAAVPASVDIVPLQVRSSLDYRLPLLYLADWAQIARLRRAFRGLDVLLINQVEAESLYDAVFAALLAKVPRIIAKVDLYGVPRRWRRLREQIIRVLLDAGKWDIVLVGDRCRKEFVALYGIAPERAHAIPNFIDDAFLTAPVHVERVSRERNALGLGSSDIVAGSLGRLSHQKGYDILLRAVGALAEQGNRVRVLLLGRGPEEAPLRALAARLGLNGRVVFREWVSGVSERIEALDVMDVFVLPSRFEGLPLSVLEAMARGKPVIGSRVNSVPDAVSDGETGWLVEPESVDDLAQALRQCVEHPQEMAGRGAKARLRYIAQFTPERAISQYLQLLGIETQ